MKYIGKKWRNLRGIVDNYGLKKSIEVLFAKVIYYIFEYTWIRMISHIRFKVKQQRIVFESSVDFSDNARALYEYMLEQHYDEKYELVWLVFKPEYYTKCNQGKTKFVKKKYVLSGCRTWRAYYYVWTAKYVFYTHSMEWGRRRNQEQLFVNLWHGCGYKAAKGEKINFDYCLVPGEVFVETKATFFQCDKKKLLPLGYPRYDWMLKSNSLTDAIWKKVCDVEVDYKKVILWMPTFRKSISPQLSECTLSGELDLPIFQNQIELLEFDKFCREKEVLIIIKRHHLQKAYQINTEFKKIVFLDDEKLAELDIQLYELLQYTDALITDYSSIAIDYLLLNKPIGYTLDDFEEYKKSRGFVFEDPLEYMPGKHIRDRIGMEGFISEISESRDLYVTERQKVSEKFHGEKKNEYCKNILAYFNM